MCSSISSCVCLTSSSIRVGWMRPSWISFSSASLAVSRRMLSKPVTTTMPGVSSTMTSTPVAFSKARMLRPSRPMIRPFMSSVGMSTVLTVVSAVCAAAYRWIAVARTSRVRCWQVSLRICSCLRISPPTSWRRSSSRRPSSSSRASSGPSWASRCSCARCSLRTLQDLLIADGQRLLLLGQAELDGIELAFAAMDQLQLLVEQVGPLLEPFLLLPEDLAALFRLGLDRLAAAEGLVLRPEFGLLLDRLGLQPRLVQDFLGQAARRPGPQPGHPEDAGQAARDPRGQQSDGACQSCPVHVGVFPFLVRLSGNAGPSPGRAQPHDREEHRRDTPEGERRGGRRAEGLRNDRHRRRQRSTLPAKSLVPRLAVNGPPAREEPSM